MSRFVRRYRDACRSATVFLSSKPAGLPPAARSVRPHIVRAEKARQSRRFATAANDHTIYALSTAPGRAAIAVIRISGPACLTIYRALCPSRPTPKPRAAVLRRLVSPVDRNQILDTGALVLYLPGPNTVTGEDVLELHVHGGPAIVRCVLESIPQCSPDTSVRYASSGEFTKRGFYNDRIDLATVESLGDALAAETEQQRRLAVSGSGSALTHRYEQWRSMLLYARGELEALIDFSEDQHFDESPADFVKSISKQIIDLRSQIRLHVKNASRGELLRNGIAVALLGAPNAGKSSLLNRLVKREAAIVSDEAGTTRDIVDVSIDLQGWLVRLGDMAGLRSLDSPIGISNGPKSGVIGQVEAEGIRRARVRATESDLVVILLSLELTEQGSAGLKVNAELTDAINECSKLGKNMVFAINKIDLLHKQNRGSTVTISRLLSDLVETFPCVDPNYTFLISCIQSSDHRLDGPEENPDGLQMFVAGLITKFQAMTAALSGQTTEMTAQEAQAYWTASLSVTHRQSQYLQACDGHLTDFLSLVEPGQPTEADQGPVSNKPSILSPPPIPSPDYFDTSETEYHVDHHRDIVYHSQDTEQSPSNPLNSAEVDIVLAAEYLRAAADELSRLTGRGDGVSGIDTEDVLGVVFEK